MRVLVSDNLGEAGIKMFEEEEGIDVDVNTGLSHEELKEVIGNYDGLVSTYIRARSGGVAGFCQSYLDNDI